MQILNDENDHELLMKRMSVPALPFIEEKKLEPVETQKRVKELPPRLSKKERRLQRDDFLSKNEVSEIIEPEVNTEEYSQSLEQVDDIHAEHDGKRLMGWMSEELEKIRQRIEFCESPPISDDPTENREIRRQIKDYQEKTLYHNADKIVDYIEGLSWYGKINPDLFGSGNYLLNETISGYKDIYEKIKECKSNMDHDEALRYLNKLAICAARPLVVDELLMKETEFEPSVSEGGVSSGTYEGGSE